MKFDFFFTKAQRFPALGIAVQNFSNPAMLGYALHLYVIVGTVTIQAARLRDN
jgi:hypothetical protein